MEFKAIIIGRVLYTRILGIPRDGELFVIFPARDSKEFYTEIGN